MDALWKKADVHESLSIPLLYFALRKGKNDLHDWRFLQTWSRKIDNWAHSDALSSLYADLLERHPKELYATFKKWNRSALPWQRRLSLTSLLYYASERTRVLSATKIFSLVRPRLDDPHPYVQKAVGWTLREASRCHPKETRAFVKKNLQKISSAAFVAAVENDPTKEKERLKSQRRDARKCRRVSFSQK